LRPADNGLLPRCDSNCNLRRSNRGRLQGWSGSKPEPAADRRRKRQFFPHLDLWRDPLYIAATCCRPALTDIRRGFEIPEQSSPLDGSSFKTRAGRKRAVRIPKNFSSRLTTRITSTMAFSPFKFLQEVRSETAKVTWPTRRETTITTIMVFVMVALASIFFFAADQVIRYLVTFLLGIH
jgi:preprotein translocase SecE subunit